MSFLNVLDRFANSNILLMLIFTSVIITCWMIIYDKYKEEEENYEYNPTPHQDTMVKVILYISIVMLAYRVVKTGLVLHAGGTFTSVL